MKVLLALLILVIGNIVFWLCVKNWDSMGDDFIDDKYGKKKHHSL